MTDTGDALAPGTRLDELEVERVLGAGGFGVTYLARDVSLDAWRAVKEYLPRDWGTRLGDGTIGPRTGADAEDYQWGLTRFLDEARVLAKFDHPHLVRVYRVFEAQGTAYMVTEYVEGQTLSAALQASGPWPEGQVRELLEALTDGLSAVHGAGLLHRDIKPGNVMVRPDGTPVLIDFGAARQAMGRQSRSVTAVLTPGYAPIEQYSPRGNQGPWTDIYALGALAYEALSGQVPDDATERVAEDPLRPLAEVAPLPVSAAMGTAVDVALALHKEDRPQSLGAWRTLLAGSAGVSPVSSRPRGGKSYGAAAATGAVGEDVVAGRAARAAAAALAWRRWWLPGAAAAGLVGVALVVALTAPWSESDPEETPGLPADAAAVAELGETVAEQAAAEQVAAEQAAAEQVAAEQAAAEQVAAEQAAAEQVAAEQAAAEQVAAEQAAAEQVAAEQAAAEQVAAEQAAAAEQVAAEQAAAAQAAAAEQRLADMRRPGRVFRDCPTCPELVVVPADRYQMGSDPRDEDSEIDERPRHPVTVDTFALGRYEVTREEYAAFVGAPRRTMSGGCRVVTATDEGLRFINDSGRSWRDPGFEQGDGHPVVCVNWEDAQAYARWLSEQTGQDYRLPSEAEWEYAARGGTQGRWYWGNDTGEQCGYANGLDTSFAAAYPPPDGRRWNLADCDDRVAQTALVGSYIPNDFGLHDMAGNVWEWVEDCWHENYARAPSDGTAWTSGGECGRRVLRGGSWYDSIRGTSVRPTATGAPRAIAYNSIGFRVARTLAP